MGDSGTRRQTHRARGVCQDGSDGASLLILRRRSSSRDCSWTGGNVGDTGLCDGNITVMAPRRISAGVFLFVLG
ncbi:unnamed protein product [Mycena citricolor]|uniref:Uncharacterized protein n=1 Tax=Mycena citricolor TaxID=2018698 RepID=A0AAD2JWJ6_9AGAR|nr:unnamed protein product [Mycena citricolor]